jgi:hypothetical protein
VSISTIYKHAKNDNIEVIPFIPFITKEAQKMISRKVKYLNSTTIIKNFDEDFMSKNLCKYENIYKNGENELKFLINDFFMSYNQQALIYFDHKVADNASVLEKFYKSYEQFYYLSLNIFKIKDKLLDIDDVKIQELLDSIDLLSFTCDYNLYEIIIKKLKNFDKNTDFVDYVKKKYNKILFDDFECEKNTNSMGLIQCGINEIDTCPLKSTYYKNINYSSGLEGGNYKNKYKKYKSKVHLLYFQ